jgi:hypothetical protein
MSATCFDYIFVVLVMSFGFSLFSFIVVNIILLSIRASYTEDRNECLTQLQNEIDVLTEYIQWLGARVENLSEAQEELVAYRAEEHYRHGDGQDLYSCGNHDYPESKPLNETLTRRRGYGLRGSGTESPIDPPEPATRADSGILADHAELGVEKAESPSNLRGGGLQLTGV